jgi:Tfp pilus assembly protein PilV
MSGAALAELLISLSILTIGVLGLLSGSRAARLQASLAADRAAEALAAQQVLERRAIGVSSDSAWVDTVRIGVREVVVRAELRDSFPGVAWLHVEAISGSGSVPWRLETARRTGD